MFHKYKKSWGVLHKSEEVLRGIPQIWDICKGYPPSLLWSWDVFHKKETVVRDVLQLRWGVLKSKLVVTSVPQVRGNRKGCPKYLRTNFETQKTFLNSLRQVGTQRKGNFNLKSQNKIIWQVFLMLYVFRRMKSFQNHQCLLNKVFNWLSF